MALNQIAGWRRLFLGGADDAGTALSAVVRPAAREDDKLRQRGLTMIEVAMVLTVMALTMGSLARLTADNAEAIKSRATAARMSEVTDAARAYVTTHYDELLALAGTGSPVVVPVGRASYGTAIPAGPSGLPSVQGGGFLPAAFIDRNPYGQRHTLLVKEPAVGELEALVTTYGGEDIPDREAGRIAGLIGAAGGFMMQNPPSGMAGQVAGAYGGWRVPASSWSASAQTPSVGRVMSTLAFVGADGDSGAATTDLLHRVDTGDPILNRMETAIDMNGNNIERAVEIDAQRLVNSAGTSVAINENLTVSGTATIDGSTGIGGNVVVAGNGTVSGNLGIGGATTSTGLVTANAGISMPGSNSLRWSTYGGGWHMTDSTYVRTIGNRGIHAGSGRIMTTGVVEAGQDVIADREVRSRDNVVAENDVLALRNVEAGADVYSLAKGRWLSQAVQDATVVAPGTAVAKPSCASLGRTPQVYVAPIAYSDNGIGRPVIAVRAWAVNSGANWIPRISVFVHNAAGTATEEVPVNANYGRALVMSKCS